MAWAQKLHLVCAVRLRAAAFVFDRIGHAAPQLDNVGNSGHAVGRGPYLDRTQNAQTGAGFPLPAIDAVMQHPPFGGEPVFGPQAFDMDQGELARAVEPVLQRRKRNVLKMVQRW